MSKKLKVGLVARADNSGLGILSWDLSKNLNFDKIMVVSAEYPTDFERYDEEKTTICDRGIPSLYEIKTFLKVWMSSLHSKLHIIGIFIK